MTETEFKYRLISEIEERLPGSIVTKLDPSFIQGIPDLLILWNDRWATLEVKKSIRERNKPRPNQEYYVNLMNEMSFSSFIFPENKEEVLHDLEEAFRNTRR